MSYTSCIFSFSFSDIQNTFYSTVGWLDNTFPPCPLNLRGWSTKKYHLHLLLNKTLLWLVAINPVLLPSSKVISDNSARPLTFVCRFQARFLSKRASSNFSLRRKDYKANFNTRVLLPNLLTLYSLPIHLFKKKKKKFCSYFQCQRVSFIFPTCMTFTAPYKVERSAILI